MRNRKTYALAVSTKRRDYSFGGDTICRDKSEILERDSDVWVEGPKLISGVAYGCGVQISEDELVLIDGGTSSITGNRIMKLNTSSNEWEIDKIHILKKRSFHTCIAFNSKILIAGGMGEKTSYLKSTEIIDLYENGTMSIRKSADLNTPRHSHGMGIINIENLATVVVFGGSSKSGTLDSVEIWDDASETWNISNLKLKQARSEFAFTSVPTELLCP